MPVTRPVITINKNQLAQRILTNARRDFPQVIVHTPPSLITLFDNFDCCIRHGRLPQGGAGGGLLVGMALNGLPLAETPVLEIYGPTQLLYSSAEEAEEHVVGFLDTSRVAFLGRGVEMDGKL